MLGYKCDSPSCLNQFFEAVVTIPPPGWVLIHAVVDKSCRIQPQMHGPRVEGLHACSTACAKVIVDIILDHHIQLAAENLKILSNITIGNGCFACR